MAAKCTVRMDLELTGLGNEIDKRIRYSTTNTPEAVQVGFGTVAAANTQEALDMGQVDNDQIDLVYLKAIDNIIFVEVVTDGAAATGNSQIRLSASEACMMRPSNSIGTLVSIMLVSATAGAKYEYTIVGQSS